MSGFGLERAEGKVSENRVEQEDEAGVQSFILLLLPQAMEFVPEQTVPSWRLCWLGLEILGDGLNSSKFNGLLSVVRRQLRSLLCVSLQTAL